MFVSYDAQSALQLSALSYLPASPWARVRDQMRNASNAQIPESHILEYFKKSIQDSLPFKRLSTASPIAIGCGSKAPAAGFQKKPAHRLSLTIKESETCLEIHQIAEAQRQRHREAMTPALRNMVQGWIIAVVMIPIWQGFGSKTGFFHLSDSVLITLLITTTVNILGLFFAGPQIFVRQAGAWVEAMIFQRKTKP